MYLQLRLAVEVIGLCCGETVPWRRLKKRIIKTILAREHVSSQMLSLHRLLSKIWIDPGFGRFVTTPVCLVYTVEDI